MIYTRFESKYSICIQNVGCSLFINITHMLVNIEITIKTHSHAHSLTHSHSTLTCTLTCILTCTHSLMHPFRWRCTHRHISSLERHVLYRSRAHSLALSLFLSLSSSLATYLYRSLDEWVFCECAQWISIWNNHSYVGTGKLRVAFCLHLAGIQFEFVNSR